MFSTLLRPFRQLAQALTDNESPQQIAWGVTLGMIIGLVPKGNLLLIVLMILLCALRVNRSAGLMAAGLFSLVGGLLDSTAHKLGSIVLLWEPARPVHVWLYELPLGPWFGTNNTVVVGQFLIGLYLAFPLYHLVFRLGRRYQPRFSKWLMRYRAIRWLRGAEFGTTWGTDA